jgi:hypothetical protein
MAKWFARAATIAIRVEVIVASLLIVSSALGGPSRAGAATPPTLDGLLQRAGAYVAEFEAGFANLVAEERYIQYAPDPMPEPHRIVMTSMVRRTLVSDFLLVKTQAAEVRPFRDVFEVDGKPVRDRADRLTDLFLHPSAMALEQAERIDAESTRYNIGIARNINVPTLMLLVLSPANQHRFKFSRLRPDRAAGPAVWSIDYAEHVHPTLMRDPEGADLSSRGRVWINATNGHVVKTELQTDDNGITTDVTTEYRPSEKVPWDVPVSMHEEYGFFRSPVHQIGTATYSKFRQFTVSPAEKLKD